MGFKYGFITYWIIFADALPTTDNNLEAMKRNKDKLREQERERRYNSVNPTDKLDDSNSLFSGKPQNDTQ